MSRPSTTRLPAPERRQAILEAATRVFAQGSYARATTAQIAREAGVSEPILYRHFASKRELYVACLDAAWDELRAALRQKIEELGPEEAPIAIARTGLGLRELRALPPNLWISAIVEAGDDPEVRTSVRRHIREVHDFVADTLRKAQARGVIPADRDADAEAWIFVAGGLLLTIGDRLGGVLGHDDFTRVATQRYRWLFGKEQGV